MISTIGGFFNLNHFDQITRANDVIVIRHKDGSLHSSPFNVRFGRAKIWNSFNKVVQVEVNGQLTTAVMKIGKGGEAYWLQPTYGDFAQRRHHAGHHPQPHKTTTDSLENVAAMAGGAATAHGGTGGQRVTFQEHPYSPVKGTVDDFVSPQQWHCATPGASSTPSPAAAGSATESGEGHLGSHAASGARTEANTLDDPTNHATGVSSAASDTSTDAVPLLQERDDGTIGVPRKAIHSAGDVEQAKLALQAVAAAEKSRKRLSRFITEDPFLMESAWQEGEATDVLRDAEDAEREEEQQYHATAQDALKKESTSDLMTQASPSAPAAAGAPQAHPVPPLDASGLEKEATSMTLAPSMSQHGSPLHPKDDTGFEKCNAEALDAAGQPATDPSSQSSKKDTEMSVHVENASVPADSRRERGKRASPAASSTANSDELAYGEADDDDYFLDPIDADDFDNDDLDVTAEVAEQVLRNCSFSSSVTSGVSINDIPALDDGAGGEDAQQPLHRPTMGGGAQKAELTTNTSYGNTATTGLGSNTSLNDSGTPKRPSRADSSTEVQDPHTTDATHRLGSRTHSGSNSMGNAAAARVNTVDGEALHDSDAEEVRLGFDRDSDNDLGPESDDEFTGDAGGEGAGASADYHGANFGHDDPNSSSTAYFTRTLLPTEEDLRKLNLVDGCNTVRYLARKNGDEVVAVTCNIFLWDSMDRLVVSDIDGTITKSDLWGHFYAALGKGGDWTHPGICSLYSKIVANGYKMVYLTARSVAQIDQTKNYLWTLEQEGVKLPLGPVLTAPQRFFTALTQEVSKQSHVFKIACLTGVKAAFPPHARPFFAGFGNRYNDLISYDAVGVPIHKIFIIDPSSVLHVCQVKQTYRNLAHLVDVTFPRIHKRRYRKHPDTTSHASHPPRNHGGSSPGSARSEGSPESSVRSEDASHGAWSGLQPANTEPLALSGNGTYGYNPHGYIPKGPLTAGPASEGSRREPAKSYGSADSPFFSSDSEKDTGLDETLRPGTTSARHKLRDDNTEPGDFERKQSAMFTLSGNDLHRSLRITGDGERPRPNAGSSAKSRASAEPTTGGSALAAAHTERSAAPSVDSQKSTVDRKFSSINASAAAATTPPQGHQRSSSVSHTTCYSCSHVEEDVMPDPEFSSFNFWRTDPRDLILTPTTTAKASDGKGNKALAKTATTSAKPPSAVGAASKDSAAPVGATATKPPAPPADAKPVGPRLGFGFGRGPSSTAKPAEKTVVVVDKSFAESTAMTHDLATTDATAAAPVDIGSTPVHPATRSRSLRSSSPPRFGTGTAKDLLPGLSGKQSTPAALAGKASVTPATSQQQTSAPPAKRGFFSFGFARGGGNVSKSEAPRATPPTRNPYCHPDYMMYDVSLPVISPKDATKGSVMVPSQPPSKPTSATPSAGTSPKLPQGATSGSTGTPSFNAAGTSTQPGPAGAKQV